MLCSAITTRAITVWPEQGHRWEALVETVLARYRFAHTAHTGRPGNPTMDPEKKSFFFYVVPLVEDGDRADVVLHHLKERH